MHFILILGMVGLDREGQITKAYYSYKDNDFDDNIDFTIKAGEYINSLHVLAANFKGRKFTLIGVLSFSRIAVDCLPCISFPA